MAAKLETTYSQNFVPSWYTNAGKDLLASQAAVSAQPYQPYTGARIADFTPEQLAGFGMTGQAATAYQPTLDAATSTAANTLGRSTLGAASPFLAAAADQSALAPAYGALSQAGQYAQASTAPTAFNMASPFLQNAANMSAAGAAAPGMQTGANLAMQSTNPTGLNLAMPFLQQAANSAASGVGSFMNPFLENVVNRYGQLGARTLQEQLMPAIQNKYIQAGQLGGPTRGGTGASGAPSGMMTDTARALRDVQEGVAQQQQQALSQGYSEALGASQAEQARMGQLASTAGGLGQAQQQALSQAGQQIGSLGQQYGALTGQGQQAMMNIGQQYGALGSGQQQALASAGQQMGALGQQFANIGQNQQQLMSTLGGQAGSMYGADTANQLAASGQLGQLAQQAQQQGLAGASAVTNVGAQQQALEQAGLDTQYQDFLRASGFNQAQIDAMAKTYGSVATGLPQASISVASSKGPSPSVVGSLAGAGLSLLGSSGSK